MKAFKRKAERSERRADDKRFHDPDGSPGCVDRSSSHNCFYLGLRSSAAMASTMAFSTLTLARLFHGFNCRGKKSIFKLGFGTNPYSLYAFGAGALLLGLVIFIPGLHRLFQVQSMLGGISAPGGSFSVHPDSYDPDETADLQKMMCKNNCKYRADLSEI